MSKEEKIDPFDKLRPSALKSSQAPEETNPERDRRVEKLIEVARSCLGMPYKYGAYLQENNGEKPGSFDCSSFSQYVFRQVEIDLPRSSILQAASDLGKEVEIKDLEPGDVIFYESTKGHYWHSKFPNGKKIYIGHNVIYTGGGNVIHAADNAELNPILQGVVEHHWDIFPKPYYDIVMVKRFIRD